MSDWLLDETAYAGPEHLDPSYVAGYERKAGFDPTEDVAALTTRGVYGDSTVIDAGAGTGAFSRAIAPLCGWVVALDPSPAMAAFLRARVTEEGLANVSVIEAGFLSYVHRGQQADAVFSRNALHQIPDFWKAIALSRLTAIVRPGGVVRIRDLVFDFEPSQVETKLEEWFGGAVDDPDVGYTREEFVTHVRTEHSTYRWLFEPMLEHAGLVIDEVGYRNSVYATYTCVRR
jgi:ubiquinone/menaquinone biosynthesis C-methylase UbiE